MRNRNVAEVLQIQSDTGSTFKDGEEPPALILKDIVISVALNGYTVTFVYDDGLEERYVLTEFSEVISLIQGSLAV